MSIDTEISIHGGLDPGQAIRVPQPSLARLPQYHHFLRELGAKGVGRVSCSQIGGNLNLVPVQVRKDLKYTGIVGRPKTGYSVPELISAIESFLGWKNANKAFLVGAGNLGTALLGHERFSHFGLSIVAAFDADPDKIGHFIHGKPVLPLEKLADLAQQTGIHLGIITAPAEHAQMIADEMVKGGIQAIWNFAPVRLKLPTNIVVQNEDLYSSLASLSRRLAPNCQVSIQADRGLQRKTPAAAIRD